MFPDSEQIGSNVFYPLFGQLFILAYKGTVLFVMRKFFLMFFNIIR